MALLACSQYGSRLRDAPLNSPYLVVQPVVQEERSIRCPSLPSPPLKDLIFEGIYEKSDPHRAQINPEAQKLYRDQTKNLRQFEITLITMANDYLRSGGQDHNAGLCTLEWLGLWAKDDAFLGRINQHGAYLRQWGLAVLSSAYLQVKTLKTDADIERWLEKIAVEVQADYKNPTESNSSKNNHLNWAAWAVTITGVALSNHDFYEWGVNKTRYAIHAQIQKNGSLPLEMNRGKKALQYHMFALSPLIMVAETAAKNGENLYDLDNGKLHALARQTFAGMRNPAWFEAQSGYKQEPAETMAKEHFSWLEVYNARFPDKAVEEWLQTYRPIFSRRTGGDSSFME